MWFMLVFSFQQINAVESSEFITDASMQWVSGLSPAHYWFPASGGLISLLVTFIFLPETWVVRSVGCVLFAVKRFLCAWAWFTSGCNVLVILWLRRNLSRGNTSTQKNVKFSAVFFVYVPTPTSSTMPEDGGGISFWDNSSFISHLEGVIREATAHLFDR